MTHKFKKLARALGIEQLATPADEARAIDIVEDALACREEIDTMRAAVAEARAEATRLATKLATATAPMIEREIDRAYVERRLIRDEHGKPSATERELRDIAVRDGIEALRQAIAEFPPQTN